ncbi:hypothetical protein BY996DRAFT_6843933 [Phakopsora pachyrhizi]|nr:hypothetical protein BY996DRAFT_6843933 [Phakopsora pachyrhizi]
MMFVPPIISDPEFCSIRFTCAFTIFTFFEFARYFALYPIGAAIHVFFHKLTGGYAGGGRAGQSIYKTDFEPVFLSQSRMDQGSRTTDQ